MDSAIIWCAHDQFQPPLLPVPGFIFWVLESQYRYGIVKIINPGNEHAQYPILWLRKVTFLHILLYDLNKVHNLSLMIPNHSLTNSFVQVAALGKHVAVLLCSRHPCTIVPSLRCAVSSVMAKRLDSKLAWASILKNESISEEAREKVMKWNIVECQEKVSKDIFHKPLPPWLPRG